MGIHLSDTYERSCAFLSGEREPYSCEIERYLRVTEALGTLDGTEHPGRDCYS